MNYSDEKSRVKIYQIRIKGHLDHQWSQWFDDFAITLDNHGISTLTGTEEGDEALYVLLKKIRDSGMPLLSLNILDNSKERI